MDFRHECVDPNPPNDELMICLATDLTGNGLDDVVIGAKDGDPSLFWYENRGPGVEEWNRHVLADVPALEVGGAFVDLTENGAQDLIAASPLDHHKAYWFEQPTDPRDEWETHLICEDFHKYHDQAVADVDDDGDLEVLLVSQKTEAVCYYDVPENPRGSGWPRSNRTYVDAGMDRAEGIQILDIDDDGRTEIVVGRRIYHRQDGAGREWTAERVAPEWDEERVRVVAADVDEDGRAELLLAECERPALHTSPDDARFAVCSAPDWDPRVVRDDLYGPHSLQVADFDGDGHLDVFIGETDYGGHETPRQLVLENRGDGTFDAHQLTQGIGTHEAKVADLTGDGSPDVVGKNDTEDAHVDVWYNETC